MTRLGKLVLFLSSFSPLALLLAVRFLDWGWWPLALAAIGVVTAAAGLGLLGAARGGQSDHFVVDAVDGRTEALTGYLIGYLFPFLVLDPGDTLTVAASALFFALLAVIYVEGNLVYLNPLLVIVGRSLWHVEVHRRDDPEDRRSLVLLVAGDMLRQNDCIVTTRVAGDVRLAQLEECDGKP